MTMMAISMFESDVANGGVENGLPTDYKLFQKSAAYTFTNVSPIFGVDINFFAWGVVPPFIYMMNSIEIGTKLSTLLLNSKLYKFSP